MDRRALVLGGGGVTGIAWATGLIAGLAGLGIDLAAADLIFGTSAGSVVGTDIAFGQEIEALYQARLAPPAPEPAARIGWDFIGRLLWDVHTSRDPKRARARIGRWALAAPTMPEADRRKVFEARLPASVWPSRALKMTAVDAQTGEFAVFDSAGARVALVRPDQAAVRAIGRNVLDVSRRAAAARAGRAQAAAAAPTVRAVWQA
jgi:NTE family protein